MERLNVVVTGGGTVAPIDDVRHIANASSGRLSAMISEACLDLGANVRHIHAPHALLPFEREAGFRLDAPDLIEEFQRLEALRETWRSVRSRLRMIPLPIGTAADYAAVLEGTLAEGPSDVVFLAMAVSDYESVPREGKIDSSAESITIECLRTDKVIRHVRDWAPDAYLVGFKLLSGAGDSELIEKAEAACFLNRVDMTVANDMKSIKAGRHRIHLVRPGRPVETWEPEDQIARKLVESVFRSVDLRRKFGKED